MRPKPPGARAAARQLLIGIGLLASPAVFADDPLAHLPPLPSGALRVCLVRHGQALSNLDPVPDLPAAQLDRLTTLGARQAEAVGHALAGLGMSAVLTSPAGRARETAEGISRALGLPSPAVEHRLRPLELGRGESGRPLTWKDRAATWQKGLDPSPPGGESMEWAGHRVAELVRALARSRRGTAVVLVAHGDVLAAYLGRVRGTPAAERYPPGLANGSITVVDVAPTGAVSIRLTSHVPPLP